MRGPSLVTFSAWRLPYVPCATRNRGGAVAAAAAAAAPPDADAVGAEAGAAAGVAAAPAAAELGGAAAVAEPLRVATCAWHSATNAAYSDSPDFLSHSAWY